MIWTKLRNSDLPFLGMIFGAALFGLGYSAGSTVHEVINDQHVTLIVAPESSRHSPNFDYRCQGDPGEQVTDTKRQQRPPRALTEGEATNDL